MAGIPLLCASVLPLKTLCKIRLMVRLIYAVKAGTSSVANTHPRQDRRWFLVGSPRFLVGGRLSLWHQAGS